MARIRRSGIPPRPTGVGGRGNVYSNAANVVFDDSASTGTVNVQCRACRPIRWSSTTSPRLYIRRQRITVTGGQGITVSGTGSIAFNTNVTAQKVTINAGAVSVGSGKTLDGGAIKVGTGTSLSVAGARAAATV